LLLNHHNHNHWRNNCPENIGESETGFPWWIIAVGAGLLVAATTLGIAWKNRRD
jgi:hypothetical protein